MSGLFYVGRLAGVKGRIGRKHDGYVYGNADALPNHIVRKGRSPLETRWVAVDVPAVFHLRSVSAHDAPSTCIHVPVVFLLCSLVWVARRKGSYCRIGTWCQTSDRADVGMLRPMTCRPVKGREAIRWS